MKKIIRILILIFILWGIPTFALNYISKGMGSLTSYITLLLLVIYFVFFVKKYSKPLLPFIFLGISYYVIGGINFIPPLFVEDYLVYFVKFIIVVVCCTEVAKDSSLEEIFVVAIFGASSVILHATVFPQYDAYFHEGYGRFSGFYLHPNYASLAALIGFSISYGIKNVTLKLIGQIVFTFAGLLTLSRFFVLIWLLINIGAVVVSRKNLMAPILGASVLAFILLSGAIKLQASRFEALESVFNDEEVKTETMQEDGRAETWAQYTDDIMNNPFFGNGFRSLQGSLGNRAGVHNTYLLVIGEAGIIAFIFLIWIVLFIIFKSIKYRKHNIYYVFLAITLATSFLVSHTFFEKYSVILMIIFIYLKLLDHENTNNELINENN